MIPDDDPLGASVMTLKDIERALISAEVPVSLRDQILAGLRDGKRVVLARKVLFVPQGDGLFKSYEIMGRKGDDG